MKLIENKELEKRIILNNKFQNNEHDGVSLEFEYLQEAKIISFVFNNANLSSLYLLDNLFERCQFVHCDFSGGALNGSKFIDCKFSNCSFRKTELQIMEIANSNFNNCDFSRSQILNTVISDTEFNGCKFRGVHLCDSNIINTIFDVWTDEMVLSINNIEENVLRNIGSS